MARKIVIPPFDSGTTQASGTKTDVREYEHVTVFAAAASVITVYADNGTTSAGTVAVPAAGFITLTDNFTFISVNAVHRVVGMFSHDG